MPTEYNIYDEQEVDRTDGGGGSGGPMIKQRRSNEDDGGGKPHAKATASKGHYHHTRPCPPKKQHFGSDTKINKDDMDISDPEIEAADHNDLTNDAHEEEFNEDNHTNNNDSEDDSEQNLQPEDDFEQNRQPGSDDESMDYDAKPRATPSQPRHTKQTFSALSKCAFDMLKEENVDDLLSDDLAWQRKVEGDSAKIKLFKTEVLQHSGMTVFVFMRPGSPFLQLLHSPQTYHTHRQDDDLRGKDIAFVGDRTNLNPNPTAVVLSEKAPWTWVAKPFHLSATALEHFYADQANKTKLWTPPKKSKALRSIPLPKLLLLPTVFVGYCAQCARTPFELYQGVCYYMSKSTANTAISLDDCRLILDWCIGASHADASNTSWLSYTVEAALPNSQRFHLWAAKRLTASLGNLPAQPTITTHRHNHEPAPPQADWKIIASQLSKGIVEGLRTSKGGNKPAAQQTDPMSTNPNKGKDYDDQQVYMLMGFAHITDVEQLPQVWAAFQTTKNSDAHRLELGSQMRAWTDTTKIPIVKNMDFSEKALGYIVKMQFNPPGCAGVAYYSSLDKGLTILTCRPPEGEDIEALRAREMLEELATTRTLADVLNTPSITGNIKPAEDYNELMLNLGTFCALLWSLFGDKCDYYCKCLSLYRAMEDTPVFVMRRNFSALLCRQMTWAIIEDGRRYFSRVLTKRHFDDHEEGGTIVFPKSLLDDLHQTAAHLTPINRPSFPSEWRPEYQGNRKRAAHTLTHGAASTAPLIQSQPTSTVRIQANNTPSVVSGLTQGSPTGTKRYKRNATITGVRETDIKPGLKTLTMAHLRNHPYLNLKQVLEHSNMTFADLPKLNEYMVNGHNTLCYNYVLGHCTSQLCQYKNRGGHAPAEKVTDAFVREMIEKMDGPFNAWDAAQAAKAKQQE